MSGKPRDLVLAPALHAALAQLRACAGVDDRAEVDLDELHAVEEAFAIRFADDLLGLFAAGALVDSHGIKLSRVIAHTGALQSRGARGDLVGIGLYKNIYVCVEKSNATTTTLVLFDPDDKSTTRVALNGWVESYLAEQPATPAAGEFKPTLVREMPGTPSGRRARHKKFGEGRILSETGTGPTRKVQVAFPNIGMKLLQARFLEFIDD